MNTTYQVGATSKIITTEAFTASTGLPYTAGAWNTATLTATYTKDGGTVTSITLATMTAGTWATGGFVHRGKGVYELGAPNAAFSTTVDGVEFAFDGISGVVFKPVRVELVGVDPRSATAPDVNVTSVGGTAQTAGDLAALITTVDDLLDSEVAAIKAKTDNLPADPADASDIAASFTTVNTKLDTIDDLLDTELPALTTAVADLPTNAELATALASADDAVLTAIDALPTNAELATALGTADDAVLAAVASLATSVDALPTNAELATALGTADDAVLAAIAALNNLSSAGAQAAAAAALTAYSAATAANVTAVPAAVLAAATAAPIAANVKEVNDVTLTGTGVNGDEWGP
jgi:hypothetical protein